MESVGYVIKVPISQTANVWNASMSMKVTQKLGNVCQSSFFLS